MGRSRDPRRERAGSAGAINAEVTAPPIILKPVMKPRTKFLIGGALVLGVSGFLMASSDKYKQTPGYKAGASLA